MPSGEGVDRRVNVFISYARADSDFARELMQKLQADGLKILDDRSVPVGTDFVALLREQIAQADSVVVLMSPEYFSSRWCQVELATAFSEEKLVLPVKIRGDIEGPLLHLVYLDANLGTKEVADKISLTLGGRPSGR